MAEEQVMPQNLVLDGKLEILAKRIENVRLRLTNEYFLIQKTKFSKLFVLLCQRYFPFDIFDLLKITDNEELLTLELEVFRRAKLSHIF